MIDLDLLRTDMERVKWSMDARGVDIDLDRLLELDDLRKRYVGVLSDLRYRHRLVTKKMGEAFRASRHQ